MKEIIPLLLVFASATASADWEQIDNRSDVGSEKFIDTKTLRQSGPMNTMRRVWEMSNLRERAPNNDLSVESLVEYDCKDAVYA